MAFRTAPILMTQGDTIHHHFYFTNSSWSPSGEHLYVVGYDGPDPNLFAIETRRPQVLERLTERNDMNPFSPAADPKGSAIYFTGGRNLYRLDLASGRTDELAAFSGGFPSNCSVSSDGEWVATSIRYPGHCRLIAVRVTDGTTHTLVEAERAIGHVQFSPVAPYRILYSGPPEARIWLVDLDGSNDRLIYDQHPSDWIVHESWLGRSGEVIFSHWPDGLFAVDPATGATRTLTRLNAWHACADPKGRTIVFDTVHPDRGLQLLDVDTRECRQLCEPKSSNLGSQWQFRVPAPTAAADPSIFRDVLAGEPSPPLDRSESTYGPQWTHPHPAFSPDGRYVVYTSDETGTPQVYVVTV